MTAIVIILIALLLFSSLYLAFKFGYEKGVHDLTQEIDEGIERLKKEKNNFMNQWAYKDYDSYKPENDSD